jgi:hypothetical protein
MKLNFLIFLSLFSVLAFSQEQLGLRLENYAGASSISLNPAGNLTNPMPWDFNLIGAGFYLDNNYGFIKNTSTLDLLKNGGNMGFILAKNVDGAFRSDEYVIDFYDDGDKRFFSFNSFVAGPSLVLKVHENHSVGFFTNMRAAASTLDLPNEFSYYKYDNRRHFDPFLAEPFDGALVTWAEVGLNYAIKIPTYTGFIGMGVNLKRLIGYEAGYLENIQPWVHTKLPDDNITVGDGYGRYGLTTSNLKEKGYGLNRNGSGLGFDLGFMYVLQEFNEGYKWRFGASILDIGSINFNKNAQAHATKNPNTFQLNLRDFDDFEYPQEIEEILRYFSYQALGDSLASQIGDQFKLSLPTALNLQADYSFTENIYLNGLIMHRFPTGHLSPRRESLLALTPRYEHRWFSVSMPVSLLNWQEIRTGVAARLGPLVIGSDKIGSLIKKSNFTGTDIYFAIKINSINLGLNLFDGAGKGGKHRYGNGKKAKCYNF